jgi:dTDP-4-dehydrorhamnose reductase
MLLVVGANGWLGRQAVPFFRSHGYAVLTASHLPGADCVLDLADSADRWRGGIPTGVDRAVFLSGVTNIDACRRNPVESRRLNVEGAVAFFREMRDRGVPFVFVSSDMVFAGDRGDYREEEPRMPTTAYGRQKKEAEDHVLAECPASLVVRLSKLYNDAPDDPSPVGQTRRDLLAGKTVRAAREQVVMPTHAVDALRAIERLMAGGHAGAYHVSAPERFTRLSLARLVARSVDREDLVEPCSIMDFPFEEPRPLDNSLNTQKLLATVNVAFSSVREHVEKGRP